MVFSKLPKLLTDDTNNWDANAKFPKSHLQNIPGARDTQRRKGTQVTARSRRQRALKVTR